MAQTGWRAIHCSKRWSSRIARSVFGNQLGDDSATAVTEGFTSYQSLVDSINIGYFLGFDDGLPVLRTPSLRAFILSSFLTR